MSHSHSPFKKDESFDRWQLIWQNWLKLGHNFFEVMQLEELRISSSNLSKSTRSAGMVTKSGFSWLPIPRSTRGREVVLLLSHFNLLVAT